MGAMRLERDQGSEEGHLLDTTLGRAHALPAVLQPPAGQLSLQPPARCRPPTALQLAPAFPPLPQPLEAAKQLENKVGLQVLPATSAATLSLIGGRPNLVCNCNASTMCKRAA